MSPGKPQDGAVLPLCRAQEGDDSCRYSVASRDPKTSGIRKRSSFLSLASLQVNNPEDNKQHEGLQIANLSPKSLPQCERHMKQVQLLFCEDHREPICLICRLTQEHQGHWVRPIEEAALEYKVGLLGGGVGSQGYFISQPWDVGALVSILGLLSGKNTIQTKPAKREFTGSCS